MRFDVVTLFPEMMAHAVAHGVTGKAIERGLVEFELWNPRDFTTDRHRTVDDRPYGGGPGMVMKVEPVRRALEAARSVDDRRGKTIYLSPQGRLIDQKAIEGFLQAGRLILLAGRYEGIDERLIEAEVDEEWSIGDYVLSGGELPALVVFDAVTRLVPGVLGHEDSAEQDSHAQGLLDHPHYTRPEWIEDRGIPEVLNSGDHEAIRKWRLRESLGRTWRRRPDMLEQVDLNEEQIKLLEEYQREFGQD